MVLLNTLENHSTLQPKLFRNLLLPAAVLHVGQPLGFKQWGYVSGSALSNKVVTLPLPAPNSIVNIHNTHVMTSAASSGDGNNDTVINTSKSQISVRTDTAVNQGHWLVLCY